MRAAPLHIVITDSGLGGISICAELESGLRKLRKPGEIRLSYFNVWPSEGLGYNDLPDMSARAAAFDAALDRMPALNPDLILIACNTLSIVYPHTRFSRRPPVPVSGIIEAGVDQFYAAMVEKPESAIVLLGTRTTIESGVHAARLIEKGIDPARIQGIACHGLASAIESDPDGESANALIAEAAMTAQHKSLPASTLYAGLCCTHYTFVRDRIAAALRAATGQAVVPLDPNGPLVADVVKSICVNIEGSYSITVKVFSKVVLGEQKRRLMAGRVFGVSELTARALLAYTHAPDLF
jgi:glutamate racemase